MKNTTHAANPDLMSDLVFLKDSVGLYAESIPVADLATRAIGEIRRLEKLVEELQAEIEVNKYPEFWL